MARIGHKKSRNGCARCKERKVKCDERTPCGACIKQRIVCSLTARYVCQKDPNPRSKRHVEAAYKISGDIPRILAADSNLPLSANPSPPGWTEDLRLMNHYTALTSATLPGACHQVWQSEVPKEAVAYPFLMHQILAISAFHLGHLQPSKARLHLIRALQHQQNAVGGIKTEVSQVTTNNCHALFIASSLLFIGAFAASTTVMCPDGRRAVDDLLNVFILLRGVGGILGSSKDQFHRGILKDFMQCDSHKMGSELLQSLPSRLDRVRKYVETSEVSPEAKALVEEALITLRERVIGASTTSPELNVAILWPMHLKDDFLALIRTYSPVALVVIAQYSLVLHAAGLLSLEWQELVTLPTN